MRRRILLVLLVGAMLSTAAAADIGQPSSFSVTISRDPGTVNLDLLVATQNPAVPAASDAMQMGVFLFAGGFPPTFVATPQITTVTAPNTRLEMTRFPPQTSPVASRVTAEM